MANDTKWAVMGGVALNFEYTRKYGFDASGAAKITAKLVSVAAPTLFQEAVQADRAARNKRLAELSHRGVLAISVVDDDGNPVKGARFLVALKDGSYLEGLTDLTGRGSVDGLAVGEPYSVTFPDLDGSDWSLQGRS